MGPGLLKGPWQSEHEQGFRDKHPGTLYSHKATDLRLGPCSPGDGPTTVAENVEVPFEATSSSVQSKALPQGVRTKPDL